METEERLDRRGNIHEIKRGEASRGAGKLVLVNLNTWANPHDGTIRAP
jgi:hypothetical protein